jgi:hypothetical protein
MFHMYKHDVPKGSITPEGMKLIKKAMHLAGCSDEWEVGFEWVWQNSKGTFAKRLQRAQYECGYRMPTDVLGKIATIAKDNVSTEDSLAYDFIDKCDWVHGDFGDANSCYWSVFNFAFSTMFQNNGIGVRAFTPIPEGCKEPFGYTKYPGYLGMGRGWIFPMTLEDGTPYLLVTNGYIAGRSSYFFARLVANHYGCSYKAGKIRSENKAMYWNEGGNCFFVADEETLERVPETITTNFTSGNEKLAHWCCRKCRKKVAADNQGTIAPGYEYFKSPDGPYCLQCAEPCQLCGRNSITPSMERKEWNIGSDRVLTKLCARCIEALTDVPCAGGCGLHHYRKDVIMVKQKIPVCLSCKRRNTSPFRECQRCWTVTSVKEMRTMPNDKMYCNKCLPSVIPLFANGNMPDETEGLPKLEGVQFFWSPTATRMVNP